MTPYDALPALVGLVLGLTALAWLTDGGGEG